MTRVLNMRSRTARAGRFACAPSTTAERKSATYQMANPTTVSRPPPSPISALHDGPDTNAEMRYASGMASAAIRSELRGILTSESFRDIAIHARKQTTTTITDKSIFACMTLTHGTGMKKNGASKKRRNTDHRATDSAREKYCIEKKYITQNPPCGGFCVRN